MIQCEWVDVVSLTSSTCSCTISELLFLVANCYPLGQIMYCGGVAVCDIIHFIIRLSTTGTRCSGHTIT